MADAAVDVSAVTAWTAEPAVAVSAVAAEALPSTRMVSRGALLPVAPVAVAAVTGVWPAEYAGQPPAIRDGRCWLTPDAEPEPVAGAAACCERPVRLGVLDPRPMVSPGTTGGPVGTACCGTVRRRGWPVPGWITGAVPPRDHLAISPEEGPRSRV